jgi:PHP family Zn ribbon phosphoesterase
MHLIPLTEIIAKAIGQRNPFTKTVTSRWEELISAFGNEISVLIEVNIEEIKNFTAPAITEAIQAFRDNKVIVKPGGGGQYGTIELPSEKEFVTISMGPLDTQTSLLDYER